MSRRTTKFTPHRKETQELQSIASEASKEAIEESVNKGLTITFIKDNQLIEQLPTGEQRVIETLDQPKGPRKGLKKGAILCRK